MIARVFFSSSFLFVLDLEGPGNKMEGTRNQNAKPKRKRKDKKGKGQARIRKQGRILFFSFLRIRPFACCGIVRYALTSE